MKRLVSGFDDGDFTAQNLFSLARRHERKRAPFQLVRVFLQQSLGHVARHEKRVATAGDTTLDGRDLAQSYETVTEFAHDFEIEIRSAQIAAPFPATVV